MSTPFDTRSRAAIAGHPLHPIIVGFPIAFLVGALVCDITFALGSDPFWALAARWLILSALLTGALAAVLGLIDLLTVPRARALTIGWLHMGGNVAAMILSLFNLLYRWDDPAGAIFPAGIAVSAFVVAIIGVTGWLGGEMVFRHKIGVINGVTNDNRPQ